LLSLCQIPHAVRAPCRPVRAGGLQQSSDRADQRVRRVGRRLLDQPHIVLDWQIAAVFAAGTATQARGSGLQYVPIVPAPGSGLAPLLSDARRPAGPARAGDYSPGDGFISIPRDYLTQPCGSSTRSRWRAPRSPVGNPTTSKATWSCPLFGRPSARPGAGRSGYTITPSNPPAGYTFPRVFTTGVWSEAWSRRYLRWASRRSTTTLPIPTTLLAQRPEGKPDPALGDQRW